MARNTENGKLAPCPNRPNCVSSQATDRGHFIEPLIYTDSAVSARNRLRQTIFSMPRAKIVRETPDRIEAEFRTRIMGFTDDAVFLFDDGRKTIDVRCASRIGYSDLGTNRKRINIIRKQFSGK